VSAAATTEVSASQVPIRQRQREPRDQREKSLRSSSVTPSSGRVSSSAGVYFSEDILRGLESEVEVEEAILEN
jgi:hypothetical protein